MEYKVGDKVLAKIIIDEIKIVWVEGKEEPSYIDECGIRYFAEDLIPSPVAEVERLIKYCEKRWKKTLSPHTVNFESGYVEALEDVLEFLKGKE